MRELERVVMLRVVDEYWMDQIDAMDDLKQGITLRAYAQEDPVVAYKREGYEMFEAMIQAIRGGDGAPDFPGPDSDQRGAEAGEGAGQRPLQSAPATRP